MEKDSSVIDLSRLTNYGEVDLRIPCLRNFEVYPTAIDASVFLPNVVNAKFCGLPVWHEVGAI